MAGRLGQFLGATLDRVIGKGGRVAASGAVHEITAGPETPMGSKAANDALRQMLRIHGDDGTAPREVVHYAYPSKHHTPSPPQAVRDYLAAHDGEVRNAVQKGGLLFIQQRDVLAETFDPFTAKLRADLAALGWDYDGWECAVEASGNDT
jgi:hypothetical protein